MIDTFFSIIPRGGIPVCLNRIRTDSVQTVGSLGDFEGENLRWAEVKRMKREETTWFFRDSLSS